MATDARLSGETDDSGRTDRPHEDSVYAIGDVHGCYDLLVCLLERIVQDIAVSNGTERSLLVFLGDYVDRGPSASEVLSALIWIQNRSSIPAVFLMGNHEQVMLRFMDDPRAHADWLSFGGDATLRSYGIDVPMGPDTPPDPVALRDRLVAAIPASHLEFINGLRPYYEDKRWIYVHAGIQPGVPMPSQDIEDLLWIRDGFLEERAPGRKRVVHGHTWKSDKPDVLAHRIGVDTGAYKTGVLTAAKLRNETFEFISTAD